MFGMCKQTCVICLFLPFDFRLFNCQTADENYRSKFDIKCSACSQPFKMLDKSAL